VFERASESLTSTSPCRSHLVPDVVTVVQNSLLSAVAIGAVAIGAVAMTTAVTLITDDAIRRWRLVRTVGLPLSIRWTLTLDYRYRLPCVFALRNLRTAHSPPGQLTRRAERYKGSLAYQA
jgi:hypothetical protein